jgi:hypothetical protein
MADGRKLVEYIFLLWPFSTIPGYGFSLRGFAITLSGHTTLGRPPLNKWSAPCGDLYLARHNIKNRWVSLTPAGFEPTIPPSERPQSHTLDRAATGIGIIIFVYFIFFYHNLLVSDTNYIYMSMDLIGKCKLFLHVYFSDLEHTLFF